uniref:receptor-interacting serine/threonine-protein kinase 3-like n=1 Tax=Pristiophorus japonicus TaxID=55135 RepID=UPI00398F5EE1
MAVSAKGVGLVVVTETQLTDRREVGSGGFGTIQRARHTGWGIDVALKVLHGSTDRCAANKDLLREAELMNSLRFPNVMCLLGLYREQNKPLGIVMEFMEGGSLASLQERVTLPWPLRARLIHQVALGMNYLHGLDPPLLHLDLNPRNVLLDDGLRAKVADFGLSKLKQIVSSEHSSSLAGTLEYLPPEALASDINQYKAAGSTDVYSFSILMWSVLTGKKPYSGVLQRGLIKLLIPQNQRPDLSLLHTLDSVEKLDLKALMEECWHSDPEQRPRFVDCCVRTEEAFQAHRASVAEAVHRVCTILNTLASSSSNVSLSDTVGALSLPDNASEAIGELRSKQSMGPEYPPPAAAVPCLGNEPSALEETSNSQLPRPTPCVAVSATNQASKISAKPTLGKSQDCEPPVLKPRAEKTMASGRTVGPIAILNSRINGLQIGDGNTMTITRSAKSKRKSRP